MEDNKQIKKCAVMDFTSQKMEYIGQKLPYI